MHIYSLCCCRVEVTLRRHIQCSTSSHNFLLTYYSPFIHSSLSSHMTDNQSDRHVLCPSHVKSSYLSKLVLMPSHRTDEHTWRRELKTSLCFLNILQKVKIEGIRSLKKGKKKPTLQNREIQPAVWKRRSCQETCPDLRRWYPKANAEWLQLAIVWTTFPRSKVEALFLLI